MLTSFEVRLIQKLCSKKLMQFETEKAFIRDKTQEKKPLGIYHKTSEYFLNRKKFVKCVTTKHKSTSIQNTFLVIIHSIRYFRFC